MKVRDVIALIEKDGWCLVRIRGDHHHYRHPLKKGLVTISGHTGQDMPPGTFKNVLKQAELDRLSEKGDRKHGSNSGNH